MALNAIIYKNYYGDDSDHTRAGGIYFITVRADNLQEEGPDFTTDLELLDRSPYETDLLI